MDERGKKMVHYIRVYRWRDRRNTKKRNRIKRVSIIEENKENGD